MIRFKCYKSFNETKTYCNTLGDEILISTLWRYAKIDFQDGEDVPERDVDGNYYNIFLPDEVNYEDEYVESMELNIDDEELKAQIDDYGDSDFIGYIEGLGFEFIDGEFDIFVTDENSLSIVKVED